MPKASHKQAKKAAKSGKPKSRSGGKSKGSYVPRSKKDKTQPEDPPEEAEEEENNQSFPDFDGNHEDDGHVGNADDSSNDGESHASNKGTQDVKFLDESDKVEEGSDDGGNDNHDDEDEDDEGGPVKRGSIVLSAPASAHDSGGTSSPPPGATNQSWNFMLYQLLLFKSQRGDFNISANDPAYNLLYNWVQNQRKHYKLYQEASSSIVGNGAAAAAAGGAGGTGASAGGNASTATAMATTVLNADRIAVLDTIEFPWNIRGDSFWQKHYDALCGYKREHGDVKVPRLYNKNLKLGEWVSDQRRQWKFKCDGKPSMMTDERKQKLDELGFVWKVRDRADWNDRYEQLLEFKKENGHCVVPQHFPRNRSLGKWVAKQREQYRFYREGRHSFLTEERIDLLKSIGFTWKIKGRGGIAKGASGGDVTAKNEDVSVDNDTKMSSNAKSAPKMETIEEDHEHEKPMADAAAVVPPRVPPMDMMPPLPKLAQRSITDPGGDVDRLSSMRLQSTMDQRKSNDSMTKHDDAMASMVGGGMDRSLLERKFSDSMNNNNIHSVMDRVGGSMLDRKFSDSITNVLDRVGGPLTGGLDRSKFSDSYPQHPMMDRDRNPMLDSMLDRERNQMLDSCDRPSMGSAGDSGKSLFSNTGNNASAASALSAASMHQQHLFEQERQHLQQRAATAASMAAIAAQHHYHHVSNLSGGRGLSNSQTMADIAAASASVPRFGDSFAAAAAAGMRGGYSSGLAGNSLGNVGLGGAGNGLGGGRGGAGNGLGGGLGGAGNGLGGGGDRQGGLGGSGGAGTGAYGANDNDARRYSNLL